jgi:hypothetical protein
MKRYFVVTDTYANFVTFCRNHNLRADGLVVNRKQAIFVNHAEAIRGYELHDGLILGPNFEQVLTDRFVDYVWPNMRSQKWRASFLISL